MVGTKSVTGFGNRLFHPGTWALTERAPWNLGPEDGTLFTVLYVPRTKLLPQDSFGECKDGELLQ